MDEGLFARVKAVYEHMDGLDREQQMVTKKLYDRFVRNGVGLEGEAKARFAEINTRLAVLSQKFGQNLLAENNAFRDAIGVTVSGYPDFMTTCEDRALREKAFKAYSSRGNHGDEHDNNAIVLEIMKLRTEKAKLLGYNTSAEYLLADKIRRHGGRRRPQDRALGLVLLCRKGARAEVRPGRVCHQAVFHG